MWTPTATRISSNAANTECSICPKRPERIFFDITVLRKFVRGAFRDSGAPPKFLKNRLLAVGKKLDCE
jgi:hypothetical protein